VSAQFSVEHSSRFGAELLPPFGLTRRALSDVDLFHVANLEASVYAFPWSFGNFKDSLIAGYRCFGLFDAKRLVAYTIVMVSLDESHLLNVAVASDFQSKGVGRFMLDCAIADAKAGHCEMLYLEVRPSNAVALSLYDKMGFKQLGMRRDYYPALGGREDALFLGVYIGSSLVIPNIESGSLQ
jgi:[ribosomal protein S18]-alanine N-acetyltransferase